MTTITPRSPASGCGLPIAGPGRVQDELVNELRQHGLHCPIRGLADPRLEHPDLLIVAGWDREEIDGGYSYRMVVDENEGTHERWEQYYEMRDDDSTVLMTRAGRKVQTLTETSEGRVSSHIRLAD